LAYSKEEKEKVITYKGKREKRFKMAKIDKIKEIAKENINLIDRIIRYINLELKLDLYKEVNLNIEEINNSNNINNNLIKSKSFYKQTIKRLLNLIERKSLKEMLLFKEVEKGNQLLEYKRAVTVKSPSYENQASFNNGYRANTHEQMLIDIYEEEQKQKQRINAYDLFVKSFEANKKMLQEFIELLPNTKAAEVLIRHYLHSERFCDIAKAIMYEEAYTLSKRGIDDLALILMSAL
jgi:hypothetical protein